MIVLGVDPGKSGALAWYDTTQPDFVHVIDVPVVDKEVSPATICAKLVAGNGRPDVAWVERVQAFKGSSPQSAFDFGKSYGMVRGLLAAQGIPTWLVTPQSWKYHHGLIGKDKDGSRGKAIALWPKCAELFARKTDDGRAEAALIAAYGAARAERGAI